MNFVSEKNFWPALGVIISVAIIGFATGLTIPMLSLRLNYRETDDLLIGALAAAPAFGMVVIAPWVQRASDCLGRKNTMLTAIGVSGFSILGLAAEDHIGILGLSRLTMGMPLHTTHATLNYRFEINDLWIFAKAGGFWRLSRKNNDLAKELSMLIELCGMACTMGAAGGVVICIGETWINELSDETRRGRIVAFYTTTYTVSQFLGPTLLAALGARSEFPMFLAGMLHLLAAGFVFAIREQAAVPIPHTNEATNFSISQFVQCAPSLCGGVLFFSFFDGTVLSFIPIYGVSEGLPEALAALMASVILGGDAVMQIPLGWLADHMNRARLYQLCGGITLGISLAFPFGIHHYLFLWPALVLLGAAAGGIYTLALIQIGQIFRGRELPTANAAATMLWGIGSLLGPLLGGIVSKILGPTGLPIMLSLAASAFLLSTIPLLNTRMDTFPSDL